MQIQVCWVTAKSEKGIQINFISIHLGLDADAKKMINIIANRLLYDEIIVKIRLFY